MPPLDRRAFECYEQMEALEPKRWRVTAVILTLTLFVCRMLEVAKAMGLTLCRQSAHSREEAGTHDEYRMVSLVLPLVHYERRMERRKRKRMN